MTLETLDQLAQTRREKAYAILGANPGPGTDVIITPEGGKYRLAGATECGQAWLTRVWLATDCDYSKIARLKSLLHDWGMRWEISWNQVIDQKID